MYGIYYHTKAWDPKCNPYLKKRGFSYDIDLDNVIKEKDSIIIPSPIPEGFINKDLGGYTIGKRYPHFLITTPFKEEEAHQIIEELSEKYNLSKQQIDNFQIFDMGEQYQIEVDNSLIIHLIYNHPSWGMKIDLVPKEYNIIGTYFPVEYNEDKIINSLYKQNKDFRDIVDNNGEVIKIKYS